MDFYELIPKLIEGGTTVVVAYAFMMVVKSAIEMMKTAVDAQTRTGEKMQILYENEMQQEKDKVRALEIKVDLQDKEFKSRISELEIELKKRDKTIAELKRKNDELEQKITELEVSDVAKDELINVLQSERDQVKTELKEVKTERDKIQAELAEVKNRLKVLEDKDKNCDEKAT